MGMIRWSPARPLKTRCPHGRLRRLLDKALPAELSVAASHLRPWASANFVGARHHFTLQLQDLLDATALSAMAVRLQDQLAETEWPLFQHIVADLCAQPAPDQQGLLLAILTVED
jgi:hypothetical protein